MKLRAKFVILGAICAAWLALAAPVLAASPAEDAYGGPGTKHHISTGTLPFTGIDSSLVALIGISLLGGGLTVRRAARSR